MTETGKLRQMDVLLACAAVLTLSAGVTVASHPVNGMLVGAAPVLFLLILRFSAARLALFVVGMLVVFGGEGTVGAPKFAYLGGVVIAAVVSTVRVMRSDAPWLSVFRPVVRATGLLLVAVSLSGVVAHFYSPFLDWVRDSSPYTLLTVAPMIALDSAHDVREKRLNLLIGAVGLVAAIGYALDWLERRGASQLPVGKVIFATSAPALLGMCFALGKIAARQQVVRWGVMAFMIPSIMLSTGGRSIVTYAAALLGVIGTRLRNRMSLARGVALALVAIVAVTLLAPMASSLVAGDDTFFEARVGMAITTLQSGGESDSSYRWRRMIYEQTWELWREHRWWGVGPGSLGNLDTPLITLAKFGIVGTSVIAVFLITIVMVSRRSGQLYGWGPMHTGIRCFAIVFIPSLPFGSRLEDKGFAMAVLFAVMGVAIAARQSSGPDQQAGQDQPAPEVTRSLASPDSVIG